MLMTLIQKEIMHHLLSVRFIALLLMCLLLVPLTLHINYRNYLQNQVNYQESIKLSTAETEEKPPNSPAPDMAETPLSETLRHSMVDLLLLCFLAVVLTTVAFLKFFRSDI